MLVRPASGEVVGVGVEESFAEVMKLRFLNKTMEINKTCCHFESSISVQYGTESEAMIPRILIGAGKRLVPHLNHRPNLIPLAAV
jgi:hypothetical protein